MSFRVIKTINNNVVSCQDENGCEYIVMGRGLGFGLKSGHTVEREQAEKVFRITDQNNMERLQTLYASLPHDQVEFCAELIEYAQSVLGHKLSEVIYYTLSDHICFAIQREKNGMRFANALHTEVRLFYPKEYAIGSYALAEIERRFHVSLPEDETASIALHLLNAEYENSLSITMQVTQTLSEMLRVLEEHPSFHVDRSSIDFDEFIVHLKFLALKQFSDDPVLEQESPLSVLIPQAFPGEYQLAGILVHPLEKASGRPLTPEQRAYLTVNLHRVNRG